MTLRYLAALLALCAAGGAAAYDYPTQARVEYVLECMYQHAGRQEYLYKCSCAIDEIAKSMKYDEFVDAGTVARYQGLGGERAGVFRDPDNMRDMAKTFRNLEAAARKTCLFAN